MYIIGGTLVLFIMILICLKSCYSSFYTALKNERRRHFHYDSEDDLNNNF